ncbi:hypothetical protein MRX96_056934 [Rhipicephalus microplus]
MRPLEKRPPDQTAPPSQTPYKKALLNNASAKVAKAPTETQRISAQKTSTQAPRGGKSSGGSPTARYSPYFTFYSVPSHYLILCSRSPGRNHPFTP